MSVLTLHSKVIFTFPSKVKEVGVAAVEVWLEFEAILCGFEGIWQPEVREWSLRSGRERRGFRRTDTYAEKEVCLNKVPIW